MLIPPGKTAAIMRVAVRETGVSRYLEGPPETLSNSQHCRVGRFKGWPLIGQYNMPRDASLSDSLGEILQSRAAYHTAWDFHSDQAYSRLRG